MAQASIISRALLGMDAPAVTVETHLPGGLPGFTLVGLPETAVREARDRVKSALQNCGFDFPRGRVVVNLAPADLVKEGARYDLAIAVSILCATKQLPRSLADRYEYLGELSLYGDVRGVRGVLGAVNSLNRRGLVVPADNAAEMRGQEQSGQVLALNHLESLPGLLRAPTEFVVAPQESVPSAAPTGPRLDEIIGQATAKRALLVAAAGGHHLLMVGPPGAGKTLLARCLAGLLPALPSAPALEVAAVYSAAGLEAPVGGAPPFREPHHSASAPALAGSATRSRVYPGEVSLAHRGVLFLDELPHFKPSVLDLLREPMSNGDIGVARAHQRTRFPASFQLVAAMNPCPSGQHCEQTSCRCSPAQVRRYQRRLSGPLLDRIDLQINVPALPARQLLAQSEPIRSEPADTSEHASARHLIAAARARQFARCGSLNGDRKSAAPQPPLNAEANELLLEAAERMRLSARTVHRCLRVAQTCADLESVQVPAEPASMSTEAHAITSAHVAEALAYRSLDWSGFLSAGSRT